MFNQLQSVLLWGYAAQRKPAETELHNRTPARSRLQGVCSGDYFFLKNIPDATLLTGQIPNRNGPFGVA
jgi:hypothetical protein